MSRSVSSVKSGGDFFSAIDYWLVTPALLLSLIGLVVLNRVLSIGYGNGSYPSNFYKQVVAVLLGITIALLLCLIDGQTLTLVSYVTYGVSILLLVWVKIDSFSLASITGADSWMLLPYIGTFQPSELAKIALALVTGTQLAKMKQGLLPFWHGVALLSLLYVVPLFLIMKQPDFGTTMVIIVMLLATIFIYGIKWRYIFLGFIGGIVSFPLMWFFMFSEYQKNRILTFVFPGQNQAASYHIEQSLAAISTGGIAGSKYGVDVSVPVKESDFIFTGVSELMGFIGTTALIILVMVFIARALHLAAKLNAEGVAGDALQLSHSYTVVALVSMMAFHFIENLGMSVGLMPITGIPLPFLSNGGTSIVVTFMALGLMLNMAMNHKRSQLEIKT